MNEQKENMNNQDKEAKELTQEQADKVSGGLHKTEDPISQDNSAVFGK